MKLKTIILISIFLLIITTTACNQTNNSKEVQNHEGIQNTDPNTNNSEDTQSGVIPDTGQNKCYDAVKEINCPDKENEYYGQDAQYETLSPKFKDNGDGTITDLNTGLMWIKDAGEKQDYYSALSKVESYSYAGYSDWRAPTIKELYTLIDFKGTDPSSGADSGIIPYIDTTYFVFNYGDTNKGDRVLDSQWITSNKYVSKVMNNQECFFGVNFADGRIKCYPTTSRMNNGYYARYVRGPSYGENNFQDNQDGTITDLSSGLMWQQEDSKKGMIWKDALNYCDTLELAEQSDWRLPDAKELEYIVDYTRSPDTTNSPAINPIFKTTQITNEAGQKDYPYFWTSTTHLNPENARYAVYISFGRAMGKMNEQWIDVHGAGAQRSDPKTGNKEEYSDGHGPQGDAIRIENYVRCVRRGARIIQINDSGINTNYQAPSENQEQNHPQPPQEAITACQQKTEEQTCDFNTPQGTLTGTCRKIDSQIACVPNQ